MSDAVLIAVVGALATVLSAIAAAWATKTGRILAATHEQVANTHSTNLRDDLDKQTAMLAAVLAGQDRQDDLIRAYAERLTALESGFLLMSARLGDGETRFAELDRHRLVVDDRLDGIAARLRNTDQL